MQWTQTLLAREELDGWQGLRPEGDYHRSPMSVHVPERAIDEEGEHKHEGALLGELVGEHQVKRVRRPASPWVGRPPVLGLAALRGLPVRLSLLGVGMLQCRMAAATLVFPRR